MHRRILFLATFAGFVGGGLFTLAFDGVTALADGDPTTDQLPRVLPYEGVIELDGDTYSGALDIRFTLYDESDIPLWTESHAVDGDSGEQVSVYAGVFSVLLGRYVDISPAVLDAEPLFVGLELRANDDGSAGEDDWVALVGRQQIGMAPFAMWAGASTNLEVGASVSVGSGDGTRSGPSWWSTASASGTTVRRDNDHAFFGTRTRGDAYSEFDAVIGWGGDASDNLVLTNQSSGNIATFSGGGDLTLHQGSIDVGSGGLNVGGCINFPRNSADDADVLLCDQDFAYPDTGVTVRPVSDLAVGEAIFRVLSIGGTERLRVEHGGEVEINNALRVSGDAYVEDLRMEADADIYGIDVINGHNDIRFDGDGNGVVDFVIDSSGFLIFEHWLDGDSFSSHDGSAQLVTIPNNSCTHGAVRPTLIGGDQPSLCVCARGADLSHGPGWYCVK